MRAPAGCKPSEMQKPIASSSSCPGVRIVTAIGRPPMRSSSGSSTATRSRSLVPPGMRTTSTAAAEYGGASMTENLLFYFAAECDVGVDRGAIGDDVVVDGAIAVDRRRDVTGRDLIRSTLGCLRDLPRREGLGHDIPLLALPRYRAAEVVSRLLEHAQDEAVELGERLGGVIAHVVLEPLH